MGPSEGGQGQIEGVKPTPILWFFKIESSSFFLVIFLCKMKVSTNILNPNYPTHSLETYFRHFFKSFSLALRTLCNNFHPKKRWSFYTVTQERRNHLVLAYLFCTQYSIGFRSFEFEFSRQKFLRKSQFRIHFCL